jgi:arylsulfatase A-like enzyme
MGHINGASDPSVTARALALIDGPAPPEVLWVHYFDLHAWMNLSAHVGTSAERYDAALRRADVELGHWLRRADRVNLVLLSDHGEGLGEHAIDYHTLFLWSSLVRVPWLVRIPGVPPAIVSTPVCTQDLAPTVVSMTRAEAASDDFNVLGLVGAPDLGQTQCIAFEAKHSAIVSGHHRLIHAFDNGSSWLYDLAQDPSEQTSLAAQNPALVSSLNAQLSGLVNAARERRARQPPEASR